MRPDYPWEGSKKCAQRAIRAALRFAGITEDDAEWATQEKMKTLETLVAKYPPLYMPSAGPVSLGNQAVLVSYATDEKMENGQTIYHLIFMSDIVPFDGKELDWAVLGWEALRERIEQERFKKAS